MSQFDFKYFIALPNVEDDFSLLQGFSHSFLMRHEQVRVILTHYPPNLIELFHFSYATLQLRLAGKSKFQVMPIVSRELSHIKIEADHPFYIVFVDSQTQPEIQKWAVSQKIPPLVLDVDEEANRKENRIRERLIKYSMSTIQAIDKASPDFDTSLIRSVTKTVHEKESFEIPFEATNHNTCLPNEITLLGCGGAFNGVADPLCGSNNIYVSSILRSAAGVTSLRSSIPDSDFYNNSPRMPSLILTSPSIAGQSLPAFGKPRSLEEKNAAEMIRRLNRQSSYSLQGNPEKMKALMNSKIAKQLLLLRTQELHAYTNALALRAASYLSPVLRIPPPNSKLREATRRFADSQRAGKKVHKLPKLSSELFHHLTDALPESIASVLEVEQTGIKIISDIALEWATVKKIPMMLRQVTSRIPTTPGNCFYAQTVPHDEIDLRPSDFGETLVIRSFKTDDPLSMHISNAVANFKLSNGSRMPVRFVDVRSSSDLIAALEDFSGAIAIFDCHGSHSKTTDIGKLHLVDEVVDMWAIRKCVNLPPIVFACACDTHAFDRSHASTANGLLIAGARTVIGTFFPIVSKPAALFAARLLFRVYEFLPAATKAIGRSMRWDRVFSLMQRMMYVSELLRVVENHFQTEWKTELQTKMTSVILDTGFYWYEGFVDLLIEEFETDTKTIETLRSEKLPFPEAIKYLQLGNPESIVIHPENVQLDASVII